MSTDLTKLITGAWAAGNNQGGLDTGTATDATYHCFAIHNPTTNTTDALFSASLTPALPAGFTHYRRIGSFTRIAGANRQFRQISNYFQYPTRIRALNGYQVSTAGELITMPVPIGIRVQVYGTLSAGTPESIFNNWSHLSILVLDGDLTDSVTYTNSAYSAFDGTVGWGVYAHNGSIYILSGTPNDIHRLTNTSGQLYFRRAGNYNSATFQTTFQVHGYTDISL
jgi:hypothetical protein